MAHDGLYKALIDGKQGGKGQGLGGLNPVARPGSSPTSQIHSQGVGHEIDSEGNLKGIETDTPTTFTLKDASSLEFKSKVGHSEYDLDGLTQSKYSDKIKPGELDLH